MDFKEPTLTLADRQGKRYATVTMNFATTESVFVTFIDAERPNETNQQERKRLIERAKEIFSAAGQS